MSARPFADDPAKEPPNDPLDDLLDAERSVRSGAAERLRRVDRVRERWEARGGASWTLDRQTLHGRALRAEVAALLTIPEVTAEALISRAELLVHDLPTTLARLGAGRFSERHAVILADAAASMDAAGRGELEARALRYAELLTVPKFARKVEHLRELIRPSEATERHREAMKDRHVRMLPGRDGMAWVNALLPASAAAGMDNYLDQIARSLRADDEQRSQAQLRADVFCDLMLDDGALLPPGEGETALRQASARPRGIRPSVHVTVPALNLTGLSEEPATLDGFGPIDPETAKELVGCAPGMYRILTAPGTGVAVQFGQERYRIPAELRRFLQVRDGTCRFIGCNRQASRCEIDHVTDWQYLGPTDAVNLTSECSGHHRLKHGSGWTLTQDALTAMVVCTAPSGRSYFTEPAMAPPRTDPPPAPGSDDWAPEGTEVPPF